MFRPDPPREVVFEEIAYSKRERGIYLCVNRYRSRDGDRGLSIEFGDYTLRTLKSCSAAESDQLLSRIVSQFESNTLEGAERYLAALTRDRFWGGKIAKLKENVWDKAAIPPIPIDMFSEITREARSRKDRATALDKMEECCWQFARHVGYPLDAAVFDAVVGLNALGFQSAYSHAGWDALIHQTYTPHPEIILCGTIAQHEALDIFIGQRQRLEELTRAQGFNSWEDLGRRAMPSIEELNEKLVGKRELSLSEWEERDKKERVELFGARELQQKIWQQSVDQCKANGLALGMGEKRELFQDKSETLQRYLNHYYEESDCEISYRVKLTSSAEALALTLHNASDIMINLKSAEIDLPTRELWSAELPLRRAEMESFGSFLKYEYLRNGRPKVHR